MAWRGRSGGGRGSTKNHPKPQRARREAVGRRRVRSAVGSSRARARGPRSDDAWRGQPRLGGQAGGAPPVAAGLKRRPASIGRGSERPRPGKSQAIRNCSFPGECCRHCRPAAPAARVIFSPSRPLCRFAPTSCTNYAVHFREECAVRFVLRA
jgi:hypothetical protein